MSMTLRLRNITELSQMVKKAQEFALEIANDYVTAKITGDTDNPISVGRLEGRNSASGMHLTMMIIVSDKEVMTTEECKTMALSIVHAVKEKIPEFDVTL